MKPIDVGEMRYRLQWRKQESGTVQGTTVSTWEIAGTFWAKVELVRGFAAFVAQQQRSGTTYTITMREGPAIRAGDKLVLTQTGQTFEVSTVARSMDLNSYLVITASELPDS